MQEIPVMEKIHTLEKSGRKKNNIKVGKGKLNIIINS